MIVDAHSAAIGMALDFAFKRREAVDGERCAAIVQNDHAQFHRATASTRDGWLDRANCNMCSIRDRILFSNVCCDANASESRAALDNAARSRCSSAMRAASNPG